MTQTTRDLARMTCHQRMVAVLSRAPVDRIPTWISRVEPNSLQAYGKLRPINLQKFLKSKLGRFVLHEKDDVLNRKVHPWLLPKMVSRMTKASLRAAIALGFDGTVLASPPVLRWKTPDTFFDEYGRLFTLEFESQGNLVGLKYLDTLVGSSELIQRWPYFPKHSETKRNTTQFFKRFLRKFGGRIALACQPGPGLWETLWQCLGFARIQLLIQTDPRFLEVFLEKLEATYTLNTDAAMSAGAEIIYYNDTLCNAGGPMLETEIIDRFLSARYQRLVSRIHNKGGKVIFRSDGRNTRLLEKYIDWGFDALDIFTTTGGKELGQVKNIVGDRVTLFGGIDTDSVLIPEKDEQYVVRAVSEALRVASHKGGYVLSASHGSGVQPHLEHIRLMVNSAKELGRYTTHLDPPKKNRKPHRPRQAAPPSAIIPVHGKPEENRITSGKEFFGEGCRFPQP